MTESKIESRYQGVLYKTKLFDDREGLVAKLFKNTEDLVYRIYIGVEGSEFNPVVESKIDFIDISDFMNRTEINEWARKHIQNLKKEGKEVYLDN